MATRDSESGLRDVFVDGKGGKISFREYLKKGPTTTIRAFSMKEGPDDIGRND